MNKGRRERQNEGSWESHNDGQSERKNILAQSQEALVKFLKRLWILPILRESKREQNRLIRDMKRKELFWWTSSAENRESSNQPPSPRRETQNEFEQNFQEIAQRTEYPLNLFFTKHLPKIKNWLEKRLHILRGLKPVAELIAGATDSIITSIKLGINIVYDAGKFALKPKEEFLRTWRTWNNKN